jgi:hypothetical protein
MKRQVAPPQGPLRAHGLYSLDQPHLSNLPTLPTAQQTQFPPKESVEKSFLIRSFLIRLFDSPQNFFRLSLDGFPSRKVHVVYRTVALGSHSKIVAVFRGVL